MSIPFTLNTPLFINSVDGIQNNTKSHDFTVRFNQGIEFDKNKNYVVALGSIAMAYSWYNVSSKYNNNTLKYSQDSGRSWHTITIPNGNFSYQELNSYIQSEIASNGHTKDGISIKFVSSMFKVLLTMKSGFQVDLKTGDFRKLLGFEKKIYTATGYSPNLPDITRSVDNVFIHTNIISDSFLSSDKSDVIYKFGVDNLPLSYPFHIQPFHLVFNKINTNRIRDLRIYITDELNRPLDLNNIPVSLILIIREAPPSPSI